MRIIDPEAVRSARLRLDECAACGAHADNLHHVVQKSSPHFGDDVFGNLVGICGSGTTGCHGAIHGSPYVVEVQISDYTGVRWEDERRDAEWVGRRIGHHLDTERPDVIQYVLTKLGNEPGREFLRRFYFLEVM